MPTPSKVSLRAELVKVLSADLASCERAHQSAREGATHDDAKPENDKDTRALEQSYLARGEAHRIEELRSALVDVQAMSLRAFAEGDPVALGALVRTEEEGGERTLVWIAPHGGGSRLADAQVQVVTPRSPLGRALLGKGVADECEVQAAGRTRIVTVVSIS